MSNATTPRLREPIGKGGYSLHVVGGAAAIPEGVMVAQLAADGTLVSGSTASSGPVIGVSTMSASIGATCEIETDRIFLFDNSTGSPCSSTTLIGAAVYAEDNHTIAAASGGTLFLAGTFQGIDPTGKVRVHISTLHASVADVGALTLTALAGTANGTLQALPDPTDTPATVDALRDDIVANLLPPLRNNIADVATQTNAIRTALKNAGLMV
jgi:hypothetical protein